MDGRTLLSPTCNTGVADQENFPKSGFLGLLIWTPATTKSEGIIERTPTNASTIPSTFCRCFGQYKQQPPEQVI